MKIQINIDYTDRHDGTDYQYITINKDSERIYSIATREVTDCPEDGTFSRGLISCYDLLDAFKAGYKLAGGKEEDIELTTEEVD